MRERKEKEREEREGERGRGRRKETRIGRRERDSGREKNKERERRKKRETEKEREEREEREEGGAPCAVHLKGRAHDSVAGDRETVLIHGRECKRQSNEREREKE